jgi:uncharacterized protein (DUF58 family)
VTPAPPSAARAESALSAGVVAALGNLELAARLVVEGAHPGRHRSLFKGLSAEFQEHRAYRPGDDLKHLDWKLLARTDRLHTRQYRDTTSLALMVVLDTSASMAFPDPGDGPVDRAGAPAVSRFRYAQLLAAALAWLAATGGDGAGLLAGSGDTLAYLPARGGRRHLRTLVARLDGLEPAGSWDGPASVDRAASLLRRRGLIVVISDLYSAESETLAALRRAALRGHDTAVLQLTSPVELAFPWKGALRFEDAESGRHRVVDAGEAAARHRAGLTAFHARCRDEAARQGIDHLLVSTDEPPATALRRFLLPRAG